MTSVQPPQYYFSGINYNPQFFNTSSGSSLTYSQALAKFVSYPSAQGNETFIVH